MKKYLAAFLITTFLCVGFSAPTTTFAADLSLSQLVELFISLGIIPTDKAAQARSMSVTTQVVDVSTCVVLTHNLYLGVDDRATAGEVSKLQQFLTATGDYTYGRLTGYFGPATEAAVERWQNRKGIVNGGSAETTGYGVVGAATRAAMSVGCTVGGTGTSMVLLKATPASGNAPLVVGFSGLTGNRIDYGDGAYDVIHEIPSGDSQFFHVYQNPGTYVATNNGRTITITVTTAGQNMTAAGTMSISVSTGIAPVDVTVTGTTGGSVCSPSSNVLYQVDYGDGTLETVSPCQSFNLHHYYQYGGTYMVQLRATVNGSNQTLSASSFTLSAPSQVYYNSTPSSNTSAPISGSLSVNHQTGVVPANATISGSVGGPGCSANPSVVYEVHYGNGSSSPINTTCGTYSFSHVYMTAGTYTIKLVGTNSLGSHDLVTLPITISS